MALEVEIPCLYSCCAESHRQQWDCLNGVRGKEGDLATGLPLELGPWKHWFLLLIPKCKDSREAVGLSCFLLFCVWRRWALYLGPERPWTAWSGVPNRTHWPTTAAENTEGRLTCSNCCWRSSQRCRVTLWSCVLLGKEWLWTAGTWRLRR